MMEALTLMPTMFEDFSYTGQWWVPEKPETKIAGKLSYVSGAGIVLVLLGNIPHLPASLEQLRKEIDQNKLRLLPDRNRMIYGDVLEHPSRVVLLNIELTDLTTHFDERKLEMSEFRQHFRAAYLFSGHWFPISIDNSVLLTEAHTAFSSMRGWMRSEFPDSLGVVIDRIKTADEQWTSSSTYMTDAYHQLKRFRISKMTAELALLAGFYFASPDGIDLYRKREGVVAIHPDQPRTLEWFIRQNNRIRDLLSFLTGLPVEKKSVLADVLQTYPPSKPSNDGHGNSEDTAPSADTVHIHHFIQPPQLDEIHADKIAFSLSHLGEVIPAVFEAWFNLTTDEWVPFALCLNVIKSEGNYPILDFLALANALESHHRNEFQSNKLDLWIRLKKLEQKLPQFLRNELALGASYLETIRDSRDYYSHYDPQIKEHRDILEGDRLDDAIRRLIPFITYFLAQKLTIKDEIIQKAFDFKRKGGYALWQRPWPVNPKPVKQEQPATN